jgi:hypothetical protein
MQKLMGLYTFDTSEILENIFLGYMFATSRAAKYANKTGFPQPCNKHQTYRSAYSYGGSLFEKNMVGKLSSCHPAGVFDAKYGAYHKCRYWPTIAHTAKIATAAVKRSDAAVGGWLGLY